MSFCVALTFDSCRLHGFGSDRFAVCKDIDFESASSEDSLSLLFESDYSKVAFCFTRFDYLCLASFNLYSKFDIIDLTSDKSEFILDKLAFVVETYDLSF